MQQDTLYTRALDVIEVKLKANPDFSTEGLVKEARLPRPDHADLRWDITKIRSSLEQ